MAKNIKFAKAEGKRIQITNEQTKQIKSMYKSALKEIEERQNFLKNKTNISSVMRRAYLDDLSKAIKDNMTAIDSATEKMIISNMAEVASAVVQNNKDMLKLLGMPESLVNSSYLYVPKDVVNEVMSGKLYEGKWTLSKAIWGDNEQKLKEIDYIVAKGIAENKSAYDLAKDLETYVNPSAKKEWEWSKVYPGTRKVIDYNAQRLSRTMVSHAYEESFVRTTKNNPFIIGYQWIISNSDRVCPLCIERSENDDYGLGPGIYPKDQLPLDHPNGMCTFEAVMSDDLMTISDQLADWVKGEGDQQLNDEIDKFAKDLGYTGSNKLNEMQKEWFKKANYEDGKMPKDFTEFAHNLSFSDQEELLKLAGGSWSDSHPYQKMEKFYNEYLATGKKFEKKYTIADLGHSKNKKKDTWYYSLPKDLQEYAKQAKKAEGLTWDQFYSKYIYNGSKPIESITKSKAKEVVKDSVIDSKDHASWISRMKKQTESEMLQSEKSSLSRMTEKQIAGIKRYTGSSFEEMNGYLRNLATGLSEKESVSKSGISSDQISDMKKAIEGMKKASLERNVILRRGTDLGDLAGFMPGEFYANKMALNEMSIEELKARFEGTIGTYAGFTSTSSLYDRGFRGSVEMIFNAPKGTEATSIMSISRFGTGEGETLLNAGTKVRIVSIEESDGHKDSMIRIFAEILN